MVKGQIQNGSKQLTIKS